MKKNKIDKSKLKKTTLSPEAIRVACLFAMAFALASFGKFEENKIVKKPIKKAKQCRKKNTA